MSASLNPYITTFDAGFDVEKSDQYRLTIQLALGGLSFALFDTSKTRLVGLEYYQSDLLADSNDLFRTLEKALDTKGLNNSTFQSIDCIIDDRTNALVPKTLFNPADNDKWLNFSFNLPKDHITMHEMLERLEVVNVFGFPNALQAKIKAKWPKANIRHSSSVFLNSLPTSEKSTVWINVRKSDFDMAIMKDKLLFFNNFRFKAKEDFAYFLLFAMEQNDLSGENTPVHFSGLLLPSSRIIGLCKRYICDIHCVEKPKELYVSEAFNEVPYPYYYIHYQAIR